MLNYYEIKEYNIRCKVFGGADQPGASFQGADHQSCKNNADENQKSGHIRIKEN